ncbi:MAG TPA: SDR family NAD(P)-dependent oxidoreductase, partial [Kofleriaceae bacterium]
MEGKTVVVTGASSGIGYETARALAKRGARVLMVVRNRDKGQAAVERILAEKPSAQLDLVLADLYSMAEVRRASAEIRANAPRVDVLVNNAGLIHDKRELTVDGCSSRNVSSATRTCASERRGPLTSRHAAVASSSSACA